MKKLIVLAVASLIATSANAAEMKWSGSAGWRYNQTKADDNMKANSNAAGATNGKNISELKNKAHAFRANLGVAGGWDNIEWGAGLRTGATGAAAAANTDWVNVQNGSDHAFNLEQAWFRYMKDFGAIDMSLTVGRQKTVLAHDGDGQVLFDVDTRWDGFGWNFKYGMFGMNATQYILGARSGSAGLGATAGNTSSSQSRTAATEASATTPSKFYYLLAFQPYMTWKFSDEIEAFVAVSHLKWSDQQNTNLVGGGYYNNHPNNGSTTSTAPAVGATNQFNIHNPKQWAVYTNWTLPYKLAASIEWVQNSKKRAVYNYGTITTPGPHSGVSQPEVSKAAWSLGLKYGGLKKAQDFSVGYLYRTKGIASVINRYAHDTFTADMKGHTINLGYMPVDNFTMGFQTIMMEEREKKRTDNGAAYPGGQKMKVTYYELTGGVMF